jgi:hypothetical protein
MQHLGRSQRQHAGFSFSSTISVSTSKILGTATPDGVSGSQSPASGAQSLAFGIEQDRSSHLTPAATFDQIQFKTRAALSQADWQVGV